VTAELAALVREAVLLALLVAAPLLVAALVAGIVTGLVGAVTQIQDPAIGTVARVAAVGLAIALFAPSIAHQVLAFAARLWPMIAAIGSSSGGGGGAG
jgi:flagellar biosynthesis protein FliQ